MLRQSSSRNYRSKKLRARHSLQALLLFAVGIWILYQLTRLYGKRRAVVVETDDGGEAAQRRLGRKGFVGFGDQASDDDTVGVGSNDVESQGAGWDREGGDGDEEDQAADEDDGGDDADDGIADDEEDDERGLLSQNGNGEDELKTLFSESDRATVFGDGDDDGNRLLLEPKALNTSSAVPRAKVNGSVQDAAAGQQTNATDGAADGRASANSAKPLSDSSLKNASAVMNLSLNDKATAGDDATKLVVNGFASRPAGIENGQHNVSMEDNRMINQNGIADSVARNDISS